MAITVERYLMVVFPILHHEHITTTSIYGSIAFIWAFTTLLISAFAYPFSGVYDGVCYLTAFFPHTSLAWFVSVYYNVAYFIVPIFMFMICYPHMMRVIKRRMKVQPGGAPNQNAKVSKRQMNLTQVMFSVSVAFVVCWAPLNIHYFLNLTGILPGLNLYDMLYRILVYLSLVNSCVNPFLYAYNYDDFKKGFRQIFPQKATVSDLTGRSDT
ncbi:hypothetical protein CAPTEDRAFT_113793 [Capitella teleta]|uniref:G-protein coupled receptors family 1 profile domain-containing protein n=1 Tax=Capitella teleta TaxID=283909 RepID=R7UCV0_CAPTE|nr:hypothetical protein CAPTEDRAFT_113793 [Capitella teleta]|eukprot:ELU03819.1 hypothetical protein CAPTEDRAFT_113793 [Capitella teleta]